MPVIDFDKVVKEYYNTVKDKYPDIPSRQFEDICHSPFYYMIECMKKKITIILVKYLGKLKIQSGTIKKLINRNEFRGNKKLITEEEYRRRYWEYKDLLSISEFEESKEKVKIIDDEN